MSVIISMIAVMVLKWVLGRYMLAARTYRAAKSYSHSEGYSGKITSGWNLGGTPGSSNLTIDGQNVSCAINASGITNKVILTSSEEDITN